MKRKFLEDLGIEKDVIDKIMDENGKDIENAKGDTDKLREQISELELRNKNLSGQVSDRDKQLNELKASSGNADELKKQIEKLQADNKATADKYKAEITQLKLSTAVEAALTKANARNNKAVEALIDMTTVKLRDDGTLEGLDEQIKKLTSDEGTSFLFNAPKAAGKPALSGAKPADPANGAPASKKPEDMTYEDFVNQVSDN